ncbi:MAG TPA: signal peptidase II [Solirubrobacteraceae bacterium]|jgi:signal peptidase II|nr:signal peptidase II [Solirubrobacteraceae bacterium]
MRSAPLAWLRAGLVMVGVVALDQLTKDAVEDSIVPGEERGLLPGVQLVDARNHGVAFGFLPGHHTAVTLVIGVAVLGLLAYFLRHSTKPLIWLPTGLLIGGALGNILDRLRDGSVTDFIKFPLGWPPFNLADASITIGVLLLVLVVESPRAHDRNVHDRLRR